MKVVVIGGLARDTRYQGSGSSQIVPTRLEQPLEEITRLADEPILISFTEGYKVSGDDDPKLSDTALALAAEADRVVVIAGLTPDYESEGSC